MLRNGAKEKCFKGLMTFNYSILDESVRIIIWNKLNEMNVKVTAKLKGLPELRELAANLISSIIRILTSITRQSHSNDYDASIFVRKLLPITRSSAGYTGIPDNLSLILLTNASDVNGTANYSDQISDFDRAISLEHAPRLTSAAIIKIYVLSLMALASLIGNFFTLWNIYRTRLYRRNPCHNWSAIYTLIFNLSIADLLVTFFCIIGDAAWYYTVEWIANDLTCRLVKLLQMFGLYLSTYVLVLIGIDRWIAVKYPMKSLNMAKRSHRLLLAVYLISFIFSLPQFFIFHVAKGPFIEEFYQCVTHGFYTSKWQEQAYTTSTLIFIFVLPLSIILFTYISTYSAIQASEKMFENNSWSMENAMTNLNQPLSQTNRQRLLHKAKTRSFRMSIVIIIAFITCWTPYNIMMMIFMFWNPNQTLSEHLRSAIFFFGMSNSLVNPLIYGAFHVKYSAKKKIHPLKRNSTSSRGTLRRDSHRTTSTMQTAVTQLDCNGRPMRNSKRINYSRSASSN